MKVRMSLVAASAIVKLNTRIKDYSLKAQVLQSRTPGKSIPLSTTVKQDN